MSRGKRVALAAVMCGGLALAPGSAQAVSADGTSAGSLGNVHVTVNGQTTHANPIAPCDLEGTLQNSTPGVSYGATKYGKGTTTCAKNANGTASAVASGQRFETSVLTQFGGPLIKLRTYSARCDTTETGSSGYVELSGIMGITVPSNIPPNFTKIIPGKQAGDPPIAEVVVNELIAPSPPDGSLTTHTMHIKLFPQGGPASGHIVVGSASCDPFGG